MFHGHRNQHRAMVVGVTMLVVCAAASIFTLTIYPGRPWWHSVGVGSASGIMIGMPIVLWLLLGVETTLGQRMKRLPLIAYLVLNAVLMTAILMAGHLAAYHLIWPENEHPFLDDPDLPASMLFSVSLVVAISVGVELRRLIGPGVFGAVLAGSYRHPREERRLFLLLDLVGSTGLAERLGPERFLALLNRLIHAMTEPLLEHDGRIYRYIGDEVILTWEWTKDAPARALAFALDALKGIDDAATAWQHDFGVVPRVRLALHGGPVIAGEIGDIKREITFLGDTLNTAARIAGEARNHQGLMLASAAALDGTPLPAGLVRRDIGPIALRGKAEPVALAVLAAAD